MTQKLFWCQQAGGEYGWKRGELDVVRWLCDLFGFSFEERGMKLWEQIEAIPPRGRLRHPDLAILIERH